MFDESVPFPLILGAAAMAFLLLVALGRLLKSEPSRSGDPAIPPRPPLAPPKSEREPLAPPASAAPSSAAPSSAAPSSAEEKIQAFVDAGQKIQAIKLYREVHGVDLLNAKRAVDAMQAGAQVPSPAQASPPGDDEIRAALEAGHKIQAIKLYRERYGVNLKEAKEAVDAMQ
jgi:ribosomal protein L7/L12